MPVREPQSWGVGGLRTREPLRRSTSEADVPHGCSEVGSVSGRAWTAGPRVVGEGQRVHIFIVAVFVGSSCTVFQEHCRLTDPT